MSLPTSWLFGALAIASIIMCFGLWPIVRKEMVGSWWGSRSFWLSAALLTHGVGAVAIFTSLLFAHIDYSGGTFMFYMLWLGWTLWLVSKTAVIHVTGRVQIAFALYALWTLMWAAWRLQIGA